MVPQFMGQYNQGQFNQDQLNQSQNQHQNQLNQNQLNQSQFGVGVGANLNGNVNSGSPALVNPTMTHQLKTSNPSTGKSKMLEINISHLPLTTQTQVPASAFQNAQPQVN